MQIEYGYDGEVVIRLVEVGNGDQAVSLAKQAIAFRSAASLAKDTISRQLDELHRSGKRVAIWGGTGKSAAFINSYGADAKRFPVVVDSDVDKAGTYVPDGGQLI